MTIKLRYNLPAIFIVSCLTFWVLMMPFEVLAQSGRITGKVTDAITKESLPGASVVIKGTTIGAASDLQGNYTINGAPAGEHTLTISYIGYDAQEKPVQVNPGRTTTVDFALSPISLQGQEVVVSVQASGQRQAINQQLASNTIENVVSESRIRSLPDVNAAESVGRLPGVSIERSGGEATKVAIRGLSPKYNLVTVNGVEIPGTGADDRSVNLSIISSNMLDGISLKKVVTPDMNADVLGGTVDLKLMEAPDSMIMNASIQGGYNRLRSYYGNYKFDASVSNRFLKDRLGLILSFNADRYNRSADIFQGDYLETTLTGTNETAVEVSNLNLREQNVERGRTGGSMVMDYRIPNGKVTLNGFYNRLNDNALNHINQLDIHNRRHYYQLNYSPKSYNSIFTGAFGLQRDFNWMSVDIGVSRSGTLAKNPSNYIYQFDQENAAFIGEPTPDTRPSEIPAMATNDSTLIALQQLFHETIHRNENVTGTQLNLKFPFRFSDHISGYLKTGGKLRWLDRMNNVERIGRDGLQYGGGRQVFVSMDGVDPQFQLDSLFLEYGHVPMFPFSSNYYRPKYLSGQFGDYPMGPVASLPIMETMWNNLAASGDTLRYYIQSLGSDYSGIERYQAAYIMAEVDLGRYITFIPGVRWEKNYTRYNGERFREVSPNNVQQPPADLEYLTITRRNNYWLPMFQLKVEPLDWLKVRLAFTETLTRPDYIQYAPITTINSYQSYVRAANSQLKPAKSKNYDAAVSVFANYIGLFTADVFYKNIEGLIFQTRYYLRKGIEPLPGMNIPINWYAKASPEVDTYINNPYKTTYKGFELEWQTNFWYLPSVLKGLVLDVNFSRIYSRTEKRLYTLKQEGIIPGSWPPQPNWVVNDTSRIARMPNQPKFIANITLGFDFKGFSARLSYLYQTNQVAYIDRKPVLDQFTGTYARWDLTLKQNLPAGFQVFANLNNLNNRRDRSYRGTTLDNPTYIENYGFTTDVGIRYQF
ncbi:MAG TPA: TonB-dependent receptor [Balneolales bacterium]|nr:TonB-dependent receptor [Balneolales bacterium]